jgi:tetratricopeptide (TPR) repeat protein
MSESTDADRYDVVKQHLLTGLDLASDERESWLSELSEREPVIADRVRQLLAAHAEAGDAFLEAPDPGGQRIGPFLVERELGRGGMGRVFLCTREESGFTQRVAIKLLPTALDDPGAVARLIDERRILAALNHPNIAHFVDGGSTADGLPYLAMEYVDGVPITTYCDRAGLTPRARIRLFLGVCGAVQFAHQRLVVHRDIKPSNILVTSDGVPKLLDFGIGKLIDQQDPGQTPTLRILTPRYASPEQVSGGAVTTATDVYSLGVLLFELLTGASPYRGVSSDSDPLTVMGAIAREPPERASAAASRMARPRVEPDVDAILLKALRKEEGERYGSVQQLAQDLTRYLDGHPVEAKIGSRTYRFRKFATRHRAGLAAAVVAVVSLIAATAVSTWQARLARQQQARAEERFTNLRRLANSLVFEVYDALESGGTAARAVLVRRASEQLDLLAADAQRDPVLADEVATSYERLATVLGNVAVANVGQLDAARRYQRQAVASRRAAFAGTAARDAGLRLVESLTRLPHYEVELAASIRPVEEAIRVAAALRARYPRDTAVWRQLLNAEFELAAQYRSAGDDEKSLSLFEAVSPRLDEFRAAVPGDDVIGRLSVMTFHRLAFLLSERGRLPEALRYLQTAFELDRAALERAPRDLIRQRELSISHTQLGYGLMTAGQLPAARGHYEEALKLRQALLADDRTNERAARDVAAAHWYIGQLDLLERRYAAAVQAHAESVRIAPVGRADAFSVDIHQGLAASLRGLGRWREAVAASRVALDRAQTYLAKDTTVMAARQELAQSGAQLVLALLGPAGTGRATAPREACDLVRRVRLMLAPSAAGLKSITPDADTQRALDWMQTACGDRAPLY